jgi:predicted permease
VAEFKGVSPDWLHALGADLLRGRDFTEADTLQAPGVVLINETLAKRYFPNDDPLGQYLKMGGSTPPLDATDTWGIREWNQIIGVVRDIKSLHPHPESVPEVYKSYWQWPMQSPTLLVRATGERASLAAAIRRETKAVIPNLPSPLIRAMDDLISESIAQPRLQTTLLLFFAILALLLATIGLYAVLAYAVAQRQREIGIRMALGAQKYNVLTMVIAQGMKLAMTGILIGLACALALAKVLRTLLYDVKPTDPFTFAAVSLLLAGVALLACWIPARRAAKLNPMEALRYE